MSGYKSCPSCGVGILVRETEPILIEENGRLYWFTEYFYSCNHSMSVAKVPRPIDVINNEINKKRGFEGIILANVFLESLSYEIISKYLSKNKIKISEEKIENLNLNELIIFLYGTKLINYEIYLKMMELKNIRNKLVHSQINTIDMKRFYLFEDDENNVIRLLNMVKDVIEYLEATRETGSTETP